MVLLSLTAAVLALAVLVPCAILALECLAACLPRRRSTPVPARPPRLAVLVPAHDEEEALPAALRTIAPELAQGDRLVVVAHNCRDRTAEVARAAGAEVVEARDGGDAGKPAALRAGLAHLERDPPEVVAIVDADCRVVRGALGILAGAAAAYGSPVQGDYRFAAGERSGVGSLSAVALLVKNVVRPTGLANLGLPCLLNGAGSAYPFDQLRSAPQGQGSIAEDYQLAIDLALAGHPTRFVPEARVESVLPVRRRPAFSQRRRWEHGHLALLCSVSPRLIARGLARRSMALLCLGLDLLVPPLALLVWCWSLSAAVAVVDLLASGSARSAVLSATAGALLAAGTLAGLWRFAGARAAFATVFRVPAYLAWKLPLYLAFPFRRETRWRKTERS